MKCLQPKTSDITDSQICHPFKYWLWNNFKQPFTLDWCYNTRCFHILTTYNRQL